VILSLAIVLDPRYKLKFVKFIYSKIDRETIEEKVKDVEDNLHILFKEYYEPNLDRKVHSDLDVLTNWKENKRRYPELSLMARDVLSIPITTVASESTFSIGGRIIGKYTSSILPANAEAKLCTKDWLCRKQGSNESDS
ncbi:hypothetical protein EJD97_019882, partial [Solanum chilense]